MTPGEATIPWSGPDFSERMLVEHLDQAHDMASRRQAVIDEHVAWLRGLVEGEAGRVLDLGCGPGLYLRRFAEAGWSGIGVDISPASIRHAIGHAPEDGSLHYIRSDLLAAEVDGSFDLVMLLFGELNTFDTGDARAIVRSIAGRLTPAGRAVIEVSTFGGVRSKGQSSPTWWATDGGLFAAGRHVVLTECAWFEHEHAAVERWWIVDDSARSPVMIGSTTWWHGADLDEVFDEAGLVVERRFGDLTGSPCRDGDELEVVVLARR